MNISPVPERSHRTVTASRPPCPYGLDTEVFSVTSAALPPPLLPSWQDRAAIPRVPVPRRAVLALPYQVACGTGDPRAVHARVTSILSQTACARSGIQNMGARPERSSRNSFSRHAFSMACDRETRRKGSAEG